MGVTHYRADWVLPVSDDRIQNGWVSVEGGRITGLGAAAPGDAVDLGHVAVLPALVNAHTHLGLSYLHRRVPPPLRPATGTLPILILLLIYSPPLSPFLRGTGAPVC